MKIFLTSDSSWESRVDQVGEYLSGFNCDDYFRERDYGDGIREIAIVLVCRQFLANKKPRNRLLRKDAILYMDVMLDFEVLKAANMEARLRITAAHLLGDVAAVVGKYKLTNFDTRKFLLDFEDWLKTTGGLSTS